METIRTKDKLFLAVVVPIALAAAYIYFWRTDAVRQVEALEREDATLVTVEDFPVERQRAQQLLTMAKEELAAEEKRPMPVAKVKANADDSIAARERAVLGIFRLAGLTVERSDKSEQEDATASGVLNRTGLRPTPVCRQYTIVGCYPQICASLRTFVEREMAVIPDRVEMTAPGRWALTLWL